MLTTLILLFFLSLGAAEKGITVEEIHPTTEYPENSLFARNTAISNIFTDFALSKPNNHLIYEEKIQTETIAAKKEASEELGKNKNRQSVSEILDYIRSKDWNYDEAYSIFECESGFDPMAFNSEDDAKKLWVETKGKKGTPFSSCGIAQNNDARCDDKTSVIYDWEYSIDLGYKKYQVRGWRPWYICAVKNNLL